MTELWGWDEAWQAEAFANGFDPKSTSVIADVLAHARARAKPVRLQVFKINQRARSLYRRLGFLETGETPTHVQMAAPMRA